MGPGVEPHLVDTIDKDMLQRNPGVPWDRVAGLKDAKATLQEAAVLPLIMPDFFKVWLELVFKSPFTQHLLCW
jgi:katanin p60 ATPase-containing subunit A1